LELQKVRDSESDFEHDRLRAKVCGHQRYPKKVSVSRWPRLTIGVIVSYGPDDLDHDAPIDRCLAVQPFALARISIGTIGRPKQPITPASHLYVVAESQPR
jgi:hypothetical protein